MKKLIKSKRNLALLISILLILLVAIFVKQIFWNSSYSSSEYKFSVQLLSLFDFELSSSISKIGR